MEDIMKWFDVYLLFYLKYLRSVHSETTVYVP